MSDAQFQRFDAGSFDGVTAGMRQSYARDGFLLLEDFVSGEDCRALKVRMQEIVGEFDPTEKAAVFSTRDSPQSREQYFFDSAREIRFFFEEEAHDSKGRLRGDFRNSLNKVGHALHDLDPIFSRFSRQPRFAELVAQLGTRDPLLLQSMYIFKPPRIGGEVQFHQDATYLWTEPQSCIGLWVALEDATVENGCLWGIPGSHLEAGPRKRYRRRDKRSEAVIIEMDDRPWLHSQSIPLEARRGTVIALHGQFAHGSGPNRSAQSRQAYSLHVVDGRCKYATDNWLQWGAGNEIRGFEGR